VFRGWFTRKKAPLAGAPLEPRLKTYTGASGYVYHYHYRGHREFRSQGERGHEFVFAVSADRKIWRDVAVMLDERAVSAWQQSAGRELTSTERYAIVKLALFEAFDGRPSPAAFDEPVRIGPDEAARFIEQLDL
jgi:hypothetical protein